jgi:hypothetical protein
MMKCMLTGLDWLTHMSNSLWRLGSEQRRDIVSLNANVAHKFG